MENRAKTKTNQPHIDYSHSMQPHKRTTSPTTIPNTQRPPTPHCYITTKPPTRVPRPKTTSTTKTTETSQAIRTTEETDDHPSRQFLLEQIVHTRTPPVMSRKMLTCVGQRCDTFSHLASASTMVIPFVHYGEPAAGQSLTEIPLAQIRD